jgi:enamine deaminase RidA (YjgF/YER057c/UK114 family)
MINRSAHTANCTTRKCPGPAAVEIYLQCRPDASAGADITRQTGSIYRGLGSQLRGENSSLGQVVYETVFFRDISRDFAPFQQARLEAYRSAGAAVPVLPAATFIEQPPLDTDADLVVSALAIRPHRDALAATGFSEPATARSFTLAGREYLFAGDICGAPGKAFDQSFKMFCIADEVLARAGMDFRNVIRTWIYLKEMQRDYGEFNRARREFFRQRRVALHPASTGIRGTPPRAGADFALAFCAMRAPEPLDVAVMTTPTLNEACTYGSDFSRGLRVVEANKIGLYVSGTASVDEEGRTAHVDDFDAQVGRMLLNVETLLAAQGASLRDVVSAFTYLKSPADAQAFRRILRERGLSAMPNVLVHAAVCRADLLCEMEAIAALPLK